MLQQLNHLRREIALNLIAVFMISFLPTERARAADFTRTNPSSNSYESTSKFRIGRRIIAPPNSIERTVEAPGTVNTFHPMIQLSNSKATPVHENKKFIGGPGQPEMAAFKSVNADNMVDLFSGDFSYNIPLLDVGGYPVNLFYNGGITMDQQASWVGLGFNINPGTIMRNMRGVPDDFDGTDLITKTQTMRPDRTWGVNAGVTTELFGLNMLRLKMSTGISFNNQRGVGFNIGLSPSITFGHLAGDNKTTSLSLGAQLNVNSQSGASISPSVSLALAQQSSVNGSLTASVGYHTRVGLQSLHLDAELSKTKTIEANQLSAELFGHSSSISFMYPAITPSIRTILTRKNYSLSFAFGQTAPMTFLGKTVGGYYSETYIADADKVTTHPAYGIMYYQKGNNDSRAMLDFNRLNDGLYTPQTPTIAIPVYTYDVFSISGEGVGGTFRAYRGDLGFVHDQETTTRDDAASLGVEFGGGVNSVHGGVNLEIVNTPTTVGAWKTNNLAKNSFAFKSSAGTYQSVYFKNPGEKAIPDITYQNAIGGEDIVRLKLLNQQTGTPSVIPTFERFNDTKLKTGDLVINNSNVAKKRDKRTQVITCLTATEASRVGFDRQIHSYNPDTTSVIFGRCDGTGDSTIERVLDYRKSHHISEIDVLGEDGRRYIYGIPVYNKTETDVTFNIENKDTTTLQSSYTPDADNTKDNQKGKDWYMEKEEIPAYTHSFLLTSLLSPNYVDVKGDGITEDDMGDAIKFNYSQFAQGYKWRTPSGSNSATWNEGLKTDNKDDKAHYIYGEREMWYLYSIESKNMVARFYVANDRKDDKEASGQNGGLNSSWGSQRLKKISLFSKGDLVKYGAAAKPIKTVYFEYSYSLCQGVPGSIGTSGENGKLTLESIYFTYNGNTKQRKNRYKFHYEENPDYDYNANDRWGTYKPRKDASSVDNNPQGMNNADYPYSIQNKTKADTYAAAWMLSRITLPSGGKIDVQFESDDYAYVQDRRAANMLQVSGFGNTASPNSTQRTNATLYASPGNEYEYVYITVPSAIASSTSGDQQREIAAKYFSGKSTQLFVKLAVTMPSDSRGSGSELIPMYLDVVSYGVVPSTSGAMIYVRTKLMESGHTAMVQYALQFIKTQLPYKAYPGYDVKENGGLRGIAMSLIGMLSNATALIKGEDKVLQSQNKCRNVVLAKSFARLSNYAGIKYGGGYRVKKVILNDSWNEMTGKHEATYGQEYKYTSSELINGTVATISSGVASWEPAIGGEENPHREILRYLNRNKGGPFDYSSVELPIAEMFFPSPSVGYSRVEVLSIHRDTVKNAPGKTVTEFFTTRDFPTKSDYTSLEDGSANVEYKPSPIMQLLKFDLKHAITVSQGFRVVLNDMNGKVKTQAAYSAADPVNPISSTTNYYNVSKNSDNTYRFNHDFPTIASADGVVEQKTVGREIEVMTDFREHKTETITSNIHFNLDFAQLVLLPVSIPTLFFPTFYETNTFRSAAVLKVVNHYSILDSVVSIDKGSMVSTKNMVYDAETGNALISRTNNEHNMPQYSFSYPAHWAYSGMGPAYKNIDAIYDNLVFRNGFLETAIDMSVFESGDELYAFSELNKGPRKQFPCDVITQPVDYLIKNPANRIWVVNTAKAGSLTPQMVFIDKDGNPYTADKASIRIIRSGKRNLLNEGVGGITALHDPVRTVASIKRVVLDDTTGILNTSAASFKDHWRVDNVQYQKDSLVNTTVYKGLTKIQVPLLHTMEVYQRRGGSPTWVYSEDLKWMDIRRWDQGKGDDQTKVWIQFDLSSFTTPSTQIVRAMLNLRAHGDPYRFKYCTEPIINHPELHTTSDPHLNGNKLQNNISIQRMLTPWYTVGQTTQWQSLFNDYRLADFNNPVGTGPAPETGIGPSTKNYSINYIGSSNSYVDQRIPITDIFKQIIVDKNTAGLTRAGGLKMEIPGGGLTDKYGVRQCFTGLTSSCTVDQPIAEVYVLDCSASTTPNPYSYDPMLRDSFACTSTVAYSFCVSKFSKKSINPYVEGIWGNWRVDTSFVYYGDRKETDPSTAVDTRKAGLIDNFKKFWNFSSTYLTRNMSAIDVWVWNTTITQYNRKGYEIENKDALGRFNAGLYGYNQQLPIAVANNSRYREMYFDGFEDYDYQTASCGTFCQPRRHVNFPAAISARDSTQKHTGRYSLRVSASSSFSFTAPVISEANAELTYGMRIKVDSTSFGDTTVISKGRGFRGKYYNLTCPGTFSPPNIDALSGAITRNFEQINLQCNPGKGSSACNTSIFKSCNGLVPPAGIHDNYFAVRWEGYVQPTVSGYYYFRTIADNGVRLYVNGTQVINHWVNDVSTITTSGIYLLKGQSYTIKMDYFESTIAETAVLLWKTPTSNSFDLIPNSVIYGPDYISDTTGSVTRYSRWCTKLDSVQVRGNALTDSFSLIQGKKMVVSCWVREGGNDCKCSTYNSNSIDISFSGSATTFQFKPAGSIIEGWQRYEGVMTIPATATAITVALTNATAGSYVYFDDLRLHPFNSNLKSFVYHPSSLRLMAELDENNYASFYEYDDDGTLNRVKKETIRGVKTITETRSALQKSVD